MTAVDDPGARADALLAEAAAACDSEAAAEALLDARELRDAEWARCRLADRLRQARGPVHVDLGSGRVHGWVESAGAEVLVLDDGRERHGVAMHGLLALGGLGPALAEDRPAVQRMAGHGWGAHARGLVGERIRLHRIDGAVLAARVVAAGADHLDLALEAGGAGAEPAVLLAVPYDAIVRITSPSRMGASTRTAWSRRTSA